MLENLREKHPRFTYHRYDAALEGEDLRIRFEMGFDARLSFRPEVVLRGLGRARWEACPAAIRDNLVFHLGLMEIPSYWKAACSLEIAVEAGPLGRDQLAWWHDLLINGMGEYFFVNQIDPSADDFVRIEVAPHQIMAPARHEQALPAHRMLVPLGGGKDSVVTTEIIRRLAPQSGCLLLNPTRAALDIAALGSYPEQITVHRTIDPLLLRLNAEGYLNGHTPFSAYLAFLSVTCAILYGYDRIPVSNERSSNEGNAMHRGREINHQYSKTFDFERKFTSYCRTYLSVEVNYFSFLRPLFELQIARQFSRSPRYFEAFRSCNRGQQTNTWCQSCPKCLFVYSILFPFMEGPQMQRIFSEDLFTRADLLPVALELLGAAEKKPLECVGTHEENLAAFYLSAKKIRASGRPLPALLQRIDETVLQKQQNLDQRSMAILTAWNAENTVPPDLQQALKYACFSGRS